MLPIFPKIVVDNRTFEMIFLIDYNLRHFSITFQSKLVPLRIIDLIAQGLIL